MRVKLFDCVSQVCPLVIFLGYVLVSTVPNGHFPARIFFNKQLTKYIIVELVPIGLVNLFLIHKTKLA